MPAQNAISIQLKGNSPYLLRDKAMFKTWKDLAAKCALKAKDGVHFPDFPSDFRNLRLRDRICHNGTSHPVVQRSLKTFLVHIQIVYIHCIYFTHTYVTWMLACASCTSCSSADALAMNLYILAGPRAQHGFGFYVIFTDVRVWILRHIHWCAGDLEIKKQLSQGIPPP